MLEISVSTIGGMMLGLEFPSIDGEDDVKWALVVDLLVLRLQFVYWKKAE